MISCPSLLLSVAFVFATMIGGRATQQDIPAPASSSESYGTAVTVLPNGNIVVVDPGFSLPNLANVGAAYLLDGATLSIISTIRGSQAGDYVGSDYRGVVVLKNGNFLVRSRQYGQGAVTWGSATTGFIGGTSNVLSSENSLIGASTITTLENGNYVVSNSLWNPGSIWNVGAVTWGNGSTGTVGTVSEANSLVGTLADDKVGGGGVRALTNGNYVVSSPDWANGSVKSRAGAVTWCNGSTGRTGPVTVDNSLIGNFGQMAVGLGGITALTNGNYVVSSPNWSSQVSRGAATWGNGTTGTAGLISATNSLVGTHASAMIITPLTNGNYVVGMPQWGDYRGSATWCNGSIGTAGIVTEENSLIGTAKGVEISGAGIFALKNGNYVVCSSGWEIPGGPLNVGAVTWGDGNTGTVGIVSAINSLVGSHENDKVGWSGVTALANGNYVVSSPEWANGSTQRAGAATWRNGAAGTVGIVSPTNSLVGSTAGDRLGTNFVTALANGNYVVASSLWDIPGGPADVGAATWGNGFSGTVGAVSSLNSLIGSQSNDQVGAGAVTALANGNYVVNSPQWANSTASRAGAVTWGNGSTGTVGTVSPANSLVGSRVDDRVGKYSSTWPLSNGGFLAYSSQWKYSTAPNFDGAVTYANGLSGSTLGTVPNSTSIYSNESAGIQIVQSANFDLLRSRFIIGRGSKGLTILTLNDGVELQTAPIKFFPDGRVSLLLLGIPSQSYKIEHSVDLVEWSVVANVVAAPDGTVRYLDSSPTISIGYYRLRQL
jgi:hypothetical protein